MKKSFLLSSILFLLINIGLQAQQQSQVQSAYMYHFTKYMEWPTSKQSGDFVIAVVGDTPITSHLKAMAAAKKAGLQTIVIKQFSSVSAVTDCHMIFISADKSSQITTAVGKGKQYNALVITEKTGYAKKGAGMNFVTVGGKARFEINESAINSNGIKVSATLSKMGIKI